MKVDTLSWNQRFALIDRFKPADAVICEALGVSSEELQTARQMRSSGTFTSAVDMDVEKYSSLFGGATTHTRKPTNSTPETASKRIREAKKRGRKGNKIQIAFMAVPTQPITASQFAKQHNVSMAVLRQAKRFDKTNIGGDVCVKMDKNKTLMIWREVK